MQIGILLRCNLSTVNNLSTVLKKQCKRRGVHFQHRFRYGKTETSRQIKKTETTKSKGD